MLAKKFANCLFKKIEIFAQPYRANVRMGNGHEMFLTLRMSATQVVKMSVLNNEIRALFDYPFSF